MKIKQGLSTSDVHAVSVNDFELVVRLKYVKGYKYVYLTLSVKVLLLKHSFRTTTNEDQIHFIQPLENVDNNSFCCIKLLFIYAL